MNNDIQPRPSSVELHPFIYAAIGLLAFWYIVAAWFLFDRNGYVAFLLAVVTGLFVMAFAIPAALWNTGHRREQRGEPAARRVSLREWAAGDFETLGERRKASVAALEVLLPLLGIALGITLIGFVWFMTSAPAPAT